MSVKINAEGGTMDSAPVVVKPLDKIAAAKIGLPVQAYVSMSVVLGLKYCWKCKIWKRKTKENFCRDRTRYDGLRATCQECYHVKNPKKIIGRRPSHLSAGMVYRIVYDAIERGALPPLSSQICQHCGDPAVHYHHHKGYAEEFLLDVIALCRRCHKAAHWGYE